MPVLVVGLNQRTVSLDVLEQLAVSQADLPKALHHLREREQLSEAVVLSTCMRTEVYVLAERFHAGLADVEQFLTGMTDASPGQVADHLYCFYEDAAVSHLFEVSAGLDSAVLGETEILSQARRAWEIAVSEKSSGPVLGALFRHAVEVGKRARSETGISRGITSVAHAAVALVSERLGGSLAGRSTLVVGAGEVGEGTATALAGLREGSEILVANRTWSKAVALAEAVGGRPVDSGRVGEALGQVDVLLTSTAAPGVLFEACDLEPVMRARGGRPLLVVDVAVPRNVDRAAAELEGVTLLDMDDIRSFAEAGMAGRRGEVAAVRALIAEEVERYLGLAAAREAAPLVAALRGRAEGIRSAELDRFRSSLETLDPRQREAVEALTRGILGKLLHEPTVQLKDAAGTPRGERLGEAVRSLFDL